tara:strand:+ start:3069 stop:3389 length:321 start_codon:yes stop_codon:yes gene_type:complete
MASAGSNPVIMILTILALTSGIITIIFFIVSKTSKVEFENCRSECEHGECSGKCSEMMSNWDKYNDKWWYIDAEEVSTLWYVLAVIFFIITVILFAPLGFIDASMG